MVHRDIKHAILSSYEATFFIHWVKKDVKGQSKNILVVAGPFFINETAKTTSMSSLKLAHVYAWFALSMGLMRSTALKIDVTKFDTTCMTRKHELQPEGGFQCE